VPPPPAPSSEGFYNPTTYQTPPQAPVPVHIVAGLVCPRCGSTKVLKGGIPVWAIVCAIVGFFLVLCISLLFLFIKDPNKCLNCGLEFK
jgi:hypothetical protein